MALSTKKSRILYIKHFKNKSRKLINTSYQCKQHVINIKINEDQAELVLLYTTIINHILLMIVQKKPKYLIRSKIINLFKDIRKHDKFIRNINK